MKNPHFTLRQSKNGLLALSLTLLYFTAMAQEGTAYFMHSLPQSTIQNPAFEPKYKFSLGFAGSSIGLQATNSGFAFNELVKRQGDSLVVDLTRFSKALAKKNYITATGDVDAFRLQFKAGQWIFMGNITARTYARIMFPKDLVAIAAEGTAKFIGETANISPEVHGQTWAEFGLGASKKISDKLRIGGRFKYLAGLASATTTRSNVTLEVGEEYDLTVKAGAQLVSSGLNTDEFEWQQQLKGNHGLGVDLGATFKLTNKLTLSASIIDLGYIKWKTNLNRLTWNPETAQYTFKGIDLEEAFEDNSKYWDDQMDSIEDAFDVTDEDGGLAFKTILPTKFFAGAQYSVVRNFNVGGVVSGEVFEGRLSPGLTISANKHFGKVLSMSLSYGASNRSWANLGAGMSINLAPFQFYVVGDNLLKAPLSLAANSDLNNFLKNAQVMNVRMGLNFVWGWQREPKPVEGEPQKEKRKAKNDKAVKAREKSQ